MSGGPVEIQPGSVGGFENSLVGAHEVESQLEAREDVQTANPFIFQTVYGSSRADPGIDDFETIIGVGAGTAGPSVNIIEGRAIALAYYYNNPEEMRSYRAKQEGALEELRERALEPPLEPSET